MADKESIRLPRLTRKNWHTWKLAAMNYICSVGIPPQWLKEESQLKTPLIPIISGAPTYGDEKSSDEFKQVVAKAYRVLTSTVADELNGTHKNLIFGDLQTFWQNLTQVRFGNETAHRRRALKRAFYNLEMKIGETFFDFESRLSTLANEINEVCGGPEKGGIREVDKYDALSLGVQTNYGREFGTEIAILDKKDQKSYDDLVSVLGPIGQNLQLKTESTTARSFNTTTTPKKNGICRMFSKGKCYFAERCKYSHDLSQSLKNQKK
jgi:hypothetical protein